MLLAGATEFETKIGQDRPSPLRARVYPALPATHGEMLPEADAPRLI
jgi:hypothetical protein